MDKPRSLSSNLSFLLGRNLLLIILLSASYGLVLGQARNAAAVTKPTASDIGTVRSSPAYAELLLKKTELQSELESLILEYTEDFPKVKVIRHTLTLIDRDIARISKVKPNEATKLTLALGKLMVRRIELESDVWNLQGTYKDEHPDVKRAKRKVEIYENAISEIID